MDSYYYSLIDEVSSIYSKIMKMDSENNYDMFVIDIKSILVNKNLDNKTLEKLLEYLEQMDYLIKTYPSFEKDIIEFREKIIWDRKEKWLKIFENELDGFISDVKSILS